MIIPENKTVGIVGLGFMGCSIAAAYRIWGYRVVALTGLDSDLDTAPVRIRHALESSSTQGIHDQDVDEMLSGIRITNQYSDLKPCFLISENLLENLEVKLNQLSLIESGVSQDTVITTNTSAIPIALLQEQLKFPRRFFGMHWAEPAYTSPYLEIICGPKTDPDIANNIYQMAFTWGKEPTLVQKDIRGFVTNRLMYALYREALYLVEHGYTNMEDIDRACRNDAGRWLTFCGPFRYMDLTGLQAYYHVMKDLFPNLSHQTEVPSFLEVIAKEGGNGITNGRGFYTYTPEEAKVWAQAFEKFRFDIHQFSKKYPSDILVHKTENKS